MTTDIYRILEIQELLERTLKGRLLVFKELIYIGEDLINRMFANQINVDAIDIIEENREGYIGYHFRHNLKYRHIYVEFNVINENKKNYNESIIEFCRVYSGV